MTFFTGRPFDSAKFILRLALAGGIVLSLLCIFFSVYMYRDSAAVYSPMARALAEGNVTEAFHPAIPCLNVLLTYPLTALGIPPEKAMTAVSCVFFTATIPVLYLLLRVFLPQLPSACGALIFVCTPKIIRFSCSGILESGKIFFLTASVYLVFRFISGGFKSYRTALLLGCALGGLTLSRSEGFGGAAVLFACAGIFFLYAVCKKQKPGILPGFAAAGTWFAVALSRVAVNGYFCHEAVFDRRIHDGIAHLFHPEKVLSAAGVAVERVPRVSWGDLVSQFSRGSYELYLVFACLGIVLMFLPDTIRRRIWADKEPPDFIRWNPFFLILWASVLANALIFKMSDIAAYRYFLPGIPLLMVFTLSGMMFVWAWAEKYLPVKWLCLGAAAVLAAQIVNGIQPLADSDARTEYRTGKEVKKELAAHPENRVWFQNASVEWYFSGTKRALPVESEHPALSDFQDFDYVLWGNDENGIDKLAERNDLREIPMPEWSTSRLFRRIK